MSRSIAWFTAALLGLSGTAGGARGSAPREPAALAVVSLNLAMREDVGRIASELAAVEVAGTTDLLLLQEVVQRGRGPSVARRLADRLGLDSMYRPAFTLDDGRSVGLAVLSRHPWHDVRVVDLARFDLVFKSRRRIALIASVNTPHGRVLVCNVHLDSRINLDQRLEQMAALSRDLASFGGAVIVGGDFNTNDMRWVFHTIPLPFLERQASGLRQFMEDLGFRSAFDRHRPTHDALGMTLDWIFLRGFRPSAAAIHPLEVSDHHALVTSIVPDWPGTSARDRHAIMGPS